MSPFLFDKVLEGIEEADSEQIQLYLEAVRERFKELYPGWEMAVHNLNLNEDVDAQIDRDIQFMQSFKNSHPLTIPTPTPPEEGRRGPLRLLNPAKKPP